MEQKQQQKQQQQRQGNSSSSGSKSTGGAGQGAAAVSVAVAGTASAKHTNSQTTQTSPSIQKQQALPTVFQDPIQSIANVLNHHHHHLEQQKRLLHSSSSSARGQKKLDQQRQQQQQQQGDEGTVSDSSSGSLRNSPSASLEDLRQAQVQQQQQQEGSRSVKTSKKASEDHQVIAGSSKKSAAGDNTSRAHKQQQQQHRTQLELRTSELTNEANQLFQRQAAGVEFKKQKQQPKQQVKGSAQDQIFEQSLDGGKVAAVTTTTLKSTASGANGNNQVEQGNSYLYAYNDFISQPAVAHLSSSSSKSQLVATAAASVDDQQQPQRRQQQEQLIRAKSNETQAQQQNQDRVTNKQQQQQQQQRDLLLLHNSRIARQDSRDKPGKKAKKFKEGGRGGVLVTANKEDEQEDDEESFLAGQVCLLTGETLSPGHHHHQLATRLATSPRLDIATSDSQEEEDDDDDDDGEAALSYILNRHNLLVAQQQQQQKAHKHAIEQQQQPHENCNLLHLNAAVVAAAAAEAAASAADNPNHLRQYLQIEENFNSYKAARRRRSGASAANNAPAGSQQHQFFAAPLAASTSKVGVEDHLHLMTGEVNYHERSTSRNHKSHELQANKYRSEQFLSFQPPPPPTATSGEQQLAAAAAAAAPTHQQQVNYLSSSSLSSSLSSLNNAQHQQHQQQQPLDTSILHTNHQFYDNNSSRAAPTTSAKSYLQFFSRFAPTSLLAASSHLSAGVGLGGSSHKMYTGQQVGSLAGQAGAYYVTTSTNSTTTQGGNQNAQDHQQQQQQQLPPHLHHLHHAHLTGTAGGTTTTGTSHGHNLGGHHAHHHHHLSGHHHAVGPHNHAHQHHHHQHHPHQQQHLHHASSGSYPIATSSDSSLGSSGPFAAGSSAVRRTTGWLRDFCSKKCLFISCLMLILFIFILVISLSAYLNFLINSNKTNLQPLSGRLRIDTSLLMLVQPPEVTSATPAPPDILNNIAAAAATNLTQQQMIEALVTNKSSSEFLAKQRDFETILRGALDRTQAMLKTYSNHLVKLEVYSFKPTLTQQQAQAQAQLQTLQQQQQQQQQQLWVYFRLFINKRTLQQDNALMKRRSPDELFESQFLPRLTQQTLLNGFEQLMATFGGGAESSASLSGGTFPSLNNRFGGGGGDAQPPPEQLGINSRRFSGGQREFDSASARRSSRAIAVASGRAHNAKLAQQGTASAAASQAAKSQQLKSFDEQMSRLMHLIEAIDLQSIFVTSDFDLSQSFSAAATAASSQFMSDTLRASQPPLPPPSTTTAASVTTTTTTTTTQQQQSTNPKANNNNNNNLSNGTLVNAANKLASTTQSGLTGGTTSAEDAAATTTPGNVGGASTRKFTLARGGYRENSTRPSLPQAATTTTSTSTTETESGQNGQSGAQWESESRKEESPFLVNQQQKPRLTTSSSSSSSSNSVQNVPSASGTGKPPGQKQAPGVLLLKAGAPITSQAGQAPHEKSLAQASQAQAVANKLAQGTSLFGAVSKQSTTVANSTAAAAAALPTRNTFTFGGATPTSSSSTPVSVGDLWQSTFSSTSRQAQSNVSVGLEVLESPTNNRPSSAASSLNSNSRRLITVSTIGDSAASPSSLRQKQQGSSGERQLRGNGNQQVNSNQLQASEGASSSPLTTTTSTQTPLSSNSSTQRPPKVSPHLNLSGAIISTTSGEASGFSNGQQQKPMRGVQQQQQQPQLSNSAVVLNRDFVSNGGGGSNATSSSARSSSQQKQQKQQKQQQQQQKPLSRVPATPSNAAGNNNQQQQQDQQAGATLRPTRNSTSSSNAGSQQKVQPAQVKPHAKVKKVTAASTTPSTSTTTLTSTRSNNAVDSQPPGNQTTSATPESSGAVVEPGAAFETKPTSSTGIRIVDNFLASIGGANNSSARQQQQQQQQQASKPQVAREQFVPTTTTIELTRGTTATPPPSRTSPSAQAPITSGNGNNFVLASQQARPGTTSFSGQWRPLAAASSNATSETAGGRTDFWASTPITPPSSINQQQRPNSSGSGNRSSQAASAARRPTSNLSLIVATERLPATLNQASGSQSPFAMPDAALVMQSGISRNSRTNSAQQPRTTTPSNDFESRRVSRMRSSVAHSHRASDHSDPSTGSSGSSSSSSSTTMSSLSTSSTMASSATMSTTTSSVDTDTAAPDTRIVDDFMITTTDRNDQQGRATTLIPPLVLSGLHKSVGSAQLGGIPRISSVVAQGPKRTRGPFAFETLRSFASAVAAPPTPTSLETPIMISPPSEPFDVSSSSSSRALNAGGFDFSEAASPALSSHAGRAERSSGRAPAQSNQVQQLQQQALAADDKLLVRKQLFVDVGPSSPSGAGDDQASETQTDSFGSATANDQATDPNDDLSFAPSTNSPIMRTMLSGNDIPSVTTTTTTTTTTGAAGDFDSVAQLTDSPDSLADSSAISSRFGKRRLATVRSTRMSSSASSTSPREKCPIFGCVVAKRNAGGGDWAQAGEFTCLNASQICDDFIDCQDASDELECVSLLKLDALTNKMAPSNGAGIIYLNRRGQLAPMCVDNFLAPSAAGAAVERGDEDSFSQTNRLLAASSSSSLASSSFDKQHQQQQQHQNNESMRRDELIRQINTIGQYACSLQSFSRLVSVKINKHDLVDGSHQIRGSKLFHRLSVNQELAAAAASDRLTGTSDRDERTDSGSSRFGSPSQSFQVEISTASDCPSERTVFVKCGSFECGQESLQLMANKHQLTTTTTANNHDQQQQQQHEDTKMLLNDDSPWLVKLYQNNSLACHGYLIDESWLVAPSQCFSSSLRLVSSASDTDNQHRQRQENVDDDELASTTSGATSKTGITSTSHLVDANEWTVEIVHEHANNCLREEDDDENINSNRASSCPPTGERRRRIKDILIQRQQLPQSQAQAGDDLTTRKDDQLLNKLGQTSPIVLAKLERPVRFSLSNRPICLPSAATTTTTGARNNVSARIESDTTNYRDCLTTSLASLSTTTSNGKDLNLASSSSGSSAFVDLPPTQQELRLQQQQHLELVAGKVQLSRPENCLRDSPETENSGRLDDHDHGAQLKGLICARESSSPFSESVASSGTQGATGSNDDQHSARVLICSKQQQLASSSRLRSKWVVVGVEHKQAAHLAQLKQGARLFVSVSSQIDWIVDTMNPKPSKMDNDTNQVNLNAETQNNASNHLQKNVQAISLPGTRISGLSSSSTAAARTNEQLNELNPLLSLFNNNQQQQQQQQTCNRFKCSSGECLSWSRICDGLYDCSSHDDEMDCHK